MNEDAELIYKKYKYATKLKALITEDYDIKFDMMDAIEFINKCDDVYMIKQRYEDMIQMLKYKK